METIEINLHGKKFSIETGKMAKQAGGSVIVRCQDSMVLVTACKGADKGADFLPLTMEYVEKTYAAGKIPGSFFKREGKLSERETLVSRLMDRPCRPMFPEGFAYDLQVIATVISADEEQDPDVLAVVGASAALTLSELPFDGPIACVRVGRVNGKLVINPTNTELKKSDMNFVVAGSRDAIVMVEGGAAEATEQDVLEALFYAHREMQPIIEMQNTLRAKVGRPKMQWAPKVDDEALKEQISSFMKKGMGEGVRIKEKLARRDALATLKQSAVSKFVVADAPDALKKTALVSKVFEDLQYKTVRDMVFTEGKRIDGRDSKTVRPISIELGSLPRAHGSALFTRGETQALVVVTLGTGDEAQRLDYLTGNEFKRFMLHYNFPSFSVGEVKPMRGPGRREIGHGALAERAVKAIMPDEGKFPYVVRIVSEILESNGSSSMATVCGSSLSLMEAGVPIKAPVAGVAMGLMKEDNRTAILTDILGDEDHLGDMDFKVCGTEKGITALQMDIKIKGLDRATVDTALSQARDGRLYILEQMRQVIGAPRVELSKRAPRIVSLRINPDKIKDVIGPGGKMIRSISESCDVKIDIEDDGTISIAGFDQDKVRAAIGIVESLTQEAVVGKLYKGIVKRIADFGAFVEILPGTDGLIHISQLADERVRRVEDVVKEGDEVTVKVLDVDRQGKIRLSLKEAIAEMKGGVPAQ
jgi:polyribonucleotide nucleotidyltransferase